MYALASDVLGQEPRNVDKLAEQMKQEMGLIWLGIDGTLSLEQPV